MSPIPLTQAPEPETSPRPHQRCKKILNTQLEILGTSETLLSLAPTPCAFHLTDGDTEGGAEWGHPGVTPDSAVWVQRKGSSWGTWFVSPPHLSPEHPLL